MVCPRCIMVVENELKTLGAKVRDVKLGYADVIIPATLTLEQIDLQMKKFGFELIHDPEGILTEQIKIVILDYLKHVHSKGKGAKKLSEYISLQIGRNYNYLSKVFSKQTGDTLEKYYINLRVEKVKELLDYNELNVSEIAVNLGYSSVHYLSNQFKNVTGFSISDYKKKSGTDRTFLDGL
ncbi:hypothetical protein MATR_02740 [Marivirga tractuosa]|nr:hypothetical protein MATR_02740 [Marivirga tractuosa]